MTGRGNALVAVERQRSSRLEVVWRLLAPPRVIILNGEAAPSDDLEYFCRSGVERACQTLGVKDTRFMIRLVRGRIVRPIDLDGFALAALVAAARAAGREDSIADSLLVGASGEWERACAGGQLNGAFASHRELMTRCSSF